MSQIYTSADQLPVIEKVFDEQQKELSQPIAVEIKPLQNFYAAEEYHQDYWAGAGQRNHYCNAVIPPKLAKLTARFAARLARQQV